MNCLWFCFLGLLCVCLGRHGLCFGFVTILSDKVRRVLSLNCSKQNYFHFYLHSANRAWWSAPVWHFDPHPSTPWISWSSCFYLVCSWWLGFQMCLAAGSRTGRGCTVLVWSSARRGAWWQMLEQPLSPERRCRQKMTMVQMSSLPKHLPFSQVVLQLVSSLVAVAKKGWGGMPALVALFWDGYLPNTLPKGSPAHFS